MCWVADHDYSGISTDRDRNRVLTKDGVVNARGTNAMFNARQVWAAPYRAKLGVLVAALVVASTGCQQLTAARQKTYNAARSLLTSSYNDANAEQKFTTAEELFNKGEHHKAQTLFADIADNTQNAALLAEKARYMEAESLREQKKYPAAVASYNRLLQDFTFGAYRERACNQMYAIAYEWLEKDTLAEIEAEQSGKKVPWWQERPSMPNVLDSKRPLFDTEGEALKTLDNVQTHDGIGPNADRALFWLGYVNFYRGRFDESDHYFSQLVEMHKDSKLRPAALDMAIMAKNNSTGGAVYDAGKAAEALQLIHHAEATMPGYATDPEKSAQMTRQKMAVRMQLAEKYFKMAEYYERTHHPASAYFYYELVTRQHPGTKYADVSKQRMDALEVVRKQMEAERGIAKPPTNDPVDFMRNQWGRLTGKPNDPSASTEPLPIAPNPKDGAVPQALPPDISNPR